MPASRYYCNRYDVVFYSVSPQVLKMNANNLPSGVTKIETERDRERDRERERCESIRSLTLSTFHGFGEFSRDYVLCNVTWIQFFRVECTSIFLITTIKTTRIFLICPRQYSLLLILIMYIYIYRPTNIKYRYIKYDIYASIVLYTPCLRSFALQTRYL